jgi:hypothetical protein
MKYELPLHDCRTIYRLTISTHTAWNPSAGSSAYQEKHKQHTQTLTLELDKIQNSTELETDFVGNDRATYMRLSV